MAWDTSRTSEAMTQNDMNQDYCVTGILHFLCHLIFLASLQGRLNYFHLIEEETEGQRGADCQRSQS